MLKFIHLLIISTFCCFSLHAQSIDIKQLKGIKARNIGPAGMSGRVTSIDVVLDQPDIIYIGSASGGVWKSESGGIKWTPIFDDEEVLSIGSIKINQNNPSEIWVGTGEGNPRNSHNSGQGIYKSIDAGKTWTKMGLDQTRTIHRIIIHRDDPNIVYVGAMGSIWGTGPERGVFKTIDGGKTWKKVLYINEQTGIADLVTDPSNPNKLIAATWEYGRHPWKFNSGGKGSGIHITYDGGETWTAITKEDGLPKGNLGRIGLAIAHGKPNIVYALVEAKVNGLYKSTDGGHQWSLVSTKNIGNRPFYYAELYVDPNNENRLWNIWSYVSKSEDGGKTFKTILDYGKGVHPDHHAFWMHPDHPNYMIDGNDGGVNISRDGGKNWRFIENLPLGQFYHITHDMDIPYNVGGGMQDNGTWIGPSSIWKRGGIRNSDWREVLFGDGFDLIIRRDNNRYGFAMSQGGHMSYIDRETGKNTYIRPVHPEEVELRFNWDAALAQHPDYDCGIYFGSQFVHRSLDCGQSWEIISPDLTTNDTIKQKESAQTGGLTLDVTNAENFTTITCIAPSAVDQQVIWVGTDDGNLQLTRDGGNNWTNLDKRLPGCPAGSWIPHIELTKNAGEAYVVVNNYRRDDWTPYLYHTTNFGQTWNRLADQQKVDGYVLCVLPDPVEPNLIFMGTDRGLYFSINAGQNWQKWTNDYPSVPTRDLKIHPRDHDLIIGTFGRAIWIMDDIRPLREIARSDGKVLEKDFNVFSATDGYFANYRSVDGVRFTADAAFRGPNKSSQSMISIWVKPEQKEKEKMEKKKTDQKENKGDKKKNNKKVKIQVLDEKGDTIRSFQRKLKPGINRTYWNLRRDGPNYPSYKDRQPDEDARSGAPVLPGTYQVLLTYQEQVDSTTINVHLDPRIPYPLEQYQQKDQAIRNFQNLIEKASLSFDRLKEAKKTVQLINDQMIHVADSTKKEVKEYGKIMNDSIANIMLLYMLPKDSKGIRRTSHTLNSQIYRAMGYLNAADTAPNSNGQFAVEKGRQKILSTLNRVNSFFENEWAAYRKKIESVPYSLFKNYERIEEK